VQAANFISDRGNDIDTYSPPPSPQPTTMDSSPTVPVPAPIRSTPTTTIIQQRRPSLPPSPNVVVDEVEHASARFYAGLDDLYTLSYIPEAIDWARESCSSIATVHLTFILMEAWGLSNAVMPWTYLFDFPSIRIVGTPSIPVKIPDLFVMLSSSFWSPVLLWSATSIFIPLLFAYFFNLTVHTVKRNNARVRVVRYNYDPFTFNVAKFMIVSTVYGAGILHGYVSDRTVAIVDSSQFSGFASMLIGTYVCGLCSLWQATQR
jgi:hypothetical protein